MSAASRERVPLANRGPTNLNHSVPAIPDFLRFTTSEAVVFGDAVDVDRMHWRAVQFIADFAPDSGIAVEGECKGGRRGYQHHFQLLTPDGESCGDIAFGGERQLGTVSVELTGAGCARVAAARPFAEAWGHVRVMLDTVSGRITEFHVAHDDYAGVRNLQTAREMYEGGSFDGAYKRPALKSDGWNDGSGETIYIGKKTATRQLVVYEKGREQGLRDGDDGVEWTRWEARFYARNRAIPNEVVEAPWEYMVGEFPCLSWISACMTVMRVAVKRSIANLHGSIRNVQRQYGAFINVVLDHVPEEKVVPFFKKLLAKSALPGWLVANPFGRESIGPALERMALRV